MYMSKKIEKLKEINRLLDEVLSNVETRIFIESVIDIKDNTGTNVLVRSE